MTDEKIIDLMLSTKTGKEWNKNVHRICKKFNGRVPPCWYTKIIASGLADNIIRKFIDVDNIRLSQLDAYWRK